MANEVEHPPSLYWMHQVQERAGFLSRAKVRYRAGLIDGRELAQIQRAYHYAVQQYTDPFGAKR